MSLVFECGVKSCEYFEKQSISINKKNVDKFNMCDEVNLYYYYFGRKLEKRIPKSLFEISFWCEDYIVMVARTI